MPGISRPSWASLRNPSQHLSVPGRPAKTSCWWSQRGESGTVQSRRTDPRINLEKGRTVTFPAQEKSQLLREGGSKGGGSGAGVEDRQGERDEVFGPLLMIALSYWPLFQHEPPSWLLNELRGGQFYIWPRTGWRREQSMETNIGCYHCCRALWGLLERWNDDWDAM